MKNNKSLKFGDSIRVEIVADSIPPKTPVEIWLHFPFLFLLVAVLDCWRVCLTRTMLLFREFRRSVEHRSLLLLVSNLSRYLQDLAVQITKKLLSTTTFVGEETYLGHLECRGPRKIKKNGRSLWWWNGAFEETQKAQGIQQLHMSLRGMTDRRFEKPWNHEDPPRRIPYFQKGFFQ